MKMVYRETTGKKINPATIVKIGEKLLEHKTIEEDCDAPEGWSTHEEIFSTEASETPAQELKRLKAEEKTAKKELEKECLEITGVNLDSRKSLENMLNDYEAAKAAKGEF